METMNSTKDYYSAVLTALQYSIGEMIVANLLWVVFTVLIVTAPPAFAGLFYATNQTARMKKSDWRTFFTGFKTYFWASWRWFLLNAGIIGILIVNIVWGSAMFNEYTLVMQAFYSSILILWLISQMYSFPMLIEQEEPKLFLAIRNSAILSLKYLPFNLLLVVVIVVISAIGTFLWPSWLVVLAGIIAYLTNLGLIYLAYTKEKAGVAEE